MTFLILLAWLAIQAPAPAAPAATATPGGPPPMTAAELQQIRQEAEAGDPLSQGLLAFAYLKGDGVVKDFAQAQSWFLKSANQGDAIAQYMLGAIYVTGGPGLLQDYAKAAPWFRKSADQGLPGSQHSLGVMYRDGNGLRKDLVEAHKWLNLAAALADPDEQRSFAEDRDTLAATMKSGDVSEAQKRARDWMTAFDKKKAASSGVGGGIVGGVGSAPPPPPPPPSAPVRVGGSIATPARTKYVLPVYPNIAQAAKVQGVVIIEATIGTDGKVTDTKILRSVPLLDAAALDSVKQWEYTPTLLNDVPVAVIMAVTVSFTLQ